MRGRLITMLLLISSFVHISKSPPTPLFQRGAAFLPLKKGDDGGFYVALLLTVLVTLLTFFLFLSTLHPSITAGDSGEISAAAFSLGIAHPPGYPLYVIIAKLFTLAVPFGNIAYRVNMASAVFGALSCVMVYVITQRILRSSESGVRGSGFPDSQLPPLFASLSLAFSYQFWYRSTVAEVYTLNTFMILIMIYILLVWMGKVSGQWSAARGREILNKSYDSRLLYLASFLLGLGMGNHHTIILVLPVALAFVAWSIAKSEVGSQKSEVTLIAHCSLLIAFFLLGISVYLYLPIRSFQYPFMDWGSPQTRQNFFDVFTRTAYLPEEMERTWGLFIGQIKSFNPIPEFTPIAIIFALLGGSGVWSYDKGVFILLFLTITLISYGLIFLAGGSGSADLLKKFYLPAYSIFSIFIGIGMAFLLGGQGFMGSWDQGAQILGPWNPRTLVVLSLAAASLIWQFTIHCPKALNSANYLAYDYGMNELNSIREGAVYITKGDFKTFPLWYLKGVERYREDVNVVTVYFLTQKWYLKEALRSIGGPSEIPRNLTYKQLLVSSIYRNNADKGVYTGFIDEEYMPKGVFVYTQGVTFLLYGGLKEGSGMDVWPKYRMRGIKKIEGDMDRGEKEMLRDYASSHYNTGVEYYGDGNSERAITEFEKALAIDPDEPDSLNNLAALYAEKGIKLREAEDMAGKAFELYTGKKDKEMARSTIEEIKKKKKGLI